MFEYDEDDFIYEVKVTDELSPSQFDRLLESKWMTAMNDGHFRYRLQELRSKTLHGKYRFLVQLNIKRANERREPQRMSNVAMPFEPALFNFSKIPDHEMLFSILRRHCHSCFDTCTNERLEGNKSGHCSVIINASPLERCHSLLVPAIQKCLPQVLTRHGVQFAMDCILLSSDRNLRAGFNSLGGHASVNHYHFHLYYLSHRLYLETAKVKHLAGECYTLVEYPAECFVFEVVLPKTKMDTINAIGVLVQFLLSKEIPHNLFMTRGTSFDQDDETKYDAVRVFIWARSATFGAKVTTNFNVAVCELSGHFPFKNEASFESTTEEELKESLYSTCHNTFISILQSVQDLYKR